MTTAEPITEPETWTHAQARHFYDLLSDQINEWQGIPVPLGDDLPLRLCPGHPLQGFFPSPDNEIQIIVGGPVDLDDAERVVNSWYDGKRNRDVYIFRKSDGRAFAVASPRAPDRSMDRLDLWLRTLGASDAWGIGAEVKAMEKLQGIVSDRQFQHYVLTGSFLETSPRSNITYLFRRLRPTVALTPRRPWWRGRSENMHVLAVLCMHPIGYYDKSWAGCMVPSDDVIAHLLSMRSDEAYFWRKANQHDAASPEAGL